ncbi:MAG: lactonase family protein [Chitinophagaceae bacterium]
MKRLFTVVITLITFITIAKAQTKEFYLIIGTYTSGKSEGVYVYKFNAINGSSSFVNSVKTDNPSYLAISKNERFVYTINETSGGKRNGRATAFSFDKKTGQLQFLNQQSVGGNGPCYIAVDRFNKWLFTANYASGSVSVLSLKENGFIDTLKQFFQHVGSSKNIQRQKEPHAHTVMLSPDQKKVFTTDLGTDQIHQYQFSQTQLTTPLIATADSVISSAAGNGPRHLAFHPTKKIMSVVNELSGTIDVFDYTTSKPILLQTISTDTTSKIDKGSADIHYSPDGKFLYVSNRGNENNIGIFSVDKKTCLLNFIALQPTEGKVPRNFTIDPTGNFLLVANQKTDNIVVFKRNPQTGLLTNTIQTINVPNPSCLKMVSVN